MSSCICRIRSPPIEYSITKKTCSFDCIHANRFTRKGWRRDVAIWNKTSSECSQNNNFCNFRNFSKNYCRNNLLLSTRARQCQLQSRGFNKAVNYLRISNCYWNNNTKKIRLKTETSKILFSTISDSTSSRPSTSPFFSTFNA